MSRGMRRWVKACPEELVSVPVDLLRELRGCVVSVANELAGADQEDLRALSDRLLDMVDRVAAAGEGIPVVVSRDRPTHVRVGGSRERCPSCDRSMVDPPRYRSGAYCSACALRARRHGWCPCGAAAYDGAVCRHPRHGARLRDRHAIPASTVSDGPGIHAAPALPALSVGGPDGAQS